MTDEYFFKINSKCPWFTKFPFTAKDHQGICKATRDFCKPQNCGSYYHSQTLSERLINWVVELVGACKRSNHKKGRAA
jgi:hypothetical protein